MSYRFQPRTLLLVLATGSLLTLGLGDAALAARARPHLDTTLGYNVLLSDNDTLLRGVSLSFDGGDPYGSLPVNLPSQESLDSLAQVYGLNTVHVFLEGDASQNPDPVGINVAVADALVQRTAAAGLYLIITIGNNGENGSIHSLQKTLDFWNFYGPRYANETHVLYEAHNEPVAFTPNHWTPEDWDKQVTMYNAIRAVAPDTFVLLGSFMSFNGPDAAVDGANYLASQGVDWSNAGFAFHGYTGLGSIEDTIAPFKTSTSLPALLCTEFWPGDTENGYNSAFESHFVGWMQFQWLFANDAELPGFQYKIDQAGTVWTPDLPTASWPAAGNPGIPADGSSVGLFDRGQGLFVSADAGSGFDLEADLASYSGSQDDLFLVWSAGPRRVHLQAANGQYASTTDEGDTVTADQPAAGPAETYEWIRLADGDVALRAYGGGGHLLTTSTRGRWSGKILPRGDDAGSEATHYAVVDGSQPTAPPSLPPPPPPPTPGPFYGTPPAIPGVIAAADYDHGGEGVAYHDTEAENFGGAYRPAEGVDVEASLAGGTHLGWVDQNEWTEYTVDVAQGGDYTLTVRVASDASGGDFHLEFDGVDRTGSLSAPGTGGWQSWADVTASVTLAAGVQVMRFASDTGGFNLKDFSFSTGGPPPPPPPGGEVFVADIVMSTSSAGGNRTRGTAVVLVHDDTGAAVSGATVSGDWSGLTSGPVSAVTGTDGRATLQSKWVRNANGTFTFTVTDVAAAGYAYNPSLNVETSDSISVP